ncbi:hypothetical protein ANTQUA_LOCUS1167 [Anthophora quadrimaculata]
MANGFPLPLRHALRNRAAKPPNRPAALFVNKSPIDEGNYHDQSGTTNRLDVSSTSLANRLSHRANSEAEERRKKAVEKPTREIKKKRKEKKVKRKVEKDKREEEKKRKREKGRKNHSREQQAVDWAFYRAGQSRLYEESHNGNLRSSLAPCPSLRPVSSFVSLYLGPRSCLQLGPPIRAVSQADPPSILPQIGQRIHAAQPERINAD